MKKKKHQATREKGYYAFGQDAAYLAEDEEAGYDYGQISMDTMEMVSLEQQGIYDDGYGYRYGYDGRDEAAEDDLYYEEIEEDGCFAEEGTEADAYYEEEEEAGEYAFYAEEEGAGEYAFYAEEEGTEADAFYAEEEGTEADAFYAEEDGTEADSYYADTEELEDLGEAAYYREPDSGEEYYDAEEEGYYAVREEEILEMEGETGAFYDETADLYAVREAFEAQYGDGYGYYEADDYSDEEDPEDEYYADDYDEEEEEIAEPAGKIGNQRSKRSKDSSVRSKGMGDSALGQIAAFFSGLLDKMSNLSAMDRIIMGTGAIVMVFAMVTCTVYASAKAVDAQVEAFSEIGGQLESVGVAGGSGLLAMAGAQSAVAEADIDELFENEEERIDVDKEDGQRIVLNMTSVEKDLKIKFVNKATGKLISGVAFEVDVNAPDGKASLWKDDDTDGIIYKKDLAAGSYKIALKDNGVLEGYQFDTGAISVTVKDRIEYKKIDVTDEVKTEAEVNAAAEDTAVQQEVESTLKDTVEWVESTKTPVNGGTESGYEEIDKDDIPDPATVARAATGFMRLALETQEPETQKEANSEPQSETGTQEPSQTESAGKPDEKPGGEPKPSEPGETARPSEPEAEKTLDSVSISSGMDLKVGESGKLSADVRFSGSGKEPSYSTSWSSEDSGIASVGSDGNVTAKAAGQTRITVTVKAGGSERSASCTVRVSENKDTSVDYVRIDGSTISLEIGGTATLSAKAYNKANEEVSGSFKWSSSREDIVKAEDGGRITGKAAGEATVTVREDGGKSASITVKVNAGLGVSLDKNTLSISINESTDLKASITGTDKRAEWKTSDSAVVSISESSDGKTAAVKGIKAGEATITVKVKDSGNKEQEASCKVTVNAENTELKVSLDKESTTVFTENKITLKAEAQSKAEIKPEGYEWSVEDDKIAQISVASDKKSVEVKGLKPGEVKVTVKVKDEKGSTASAECKVTVKLNPKEDDSTHLKDKDGNSVYIRNDKGEYVKATYKDYYKDQKFYIKVDNVEYKYTGWQTIDGKTYFFTKDGEKVKGDQVIQGAKYSFGDDGVLRSNSGIMGIDVSKWNGNINWEAVKNSGVSYVIIRCGYRGSSTGAMVVDPKFKSNIQGAANAGLKVGIYFFSQATSEREAVEEASMTLSLIKGYKISYPVFIDLEGSGGRGDKIDKGTRTAVANAFCKTIQNGGYTAGIYANKTWFETKMSTGSLTGYKLWLAQYAAAPTYKATRYDMWQYTSKGSIPGISGNVDLNLSYLGY